MKVTHNKVVPIKFIIKEFPRATFSAQDKLFLLLVFFVCFGYIERKLTCNQQKLDGKYIVTTNDIVNIKRKV